MLLNVQVKDYHCILAEVQIRTSADPYSGRAPSHRGIWVGWSRVETNL